MTSVYRNCFESSSGSTEEQDITPSLSLLIRLTLFGWDNRMVYRSSFLKRIDVSYRIWYSAASWGMRCGIGLVTGQIDGLLPLERAPKGYALSVIRRFRENAFGLAKYMLYRALPVPAYAYVLSVCARVRGPRQIAP